MTDYNKVLLKVCSSGGWGPGDNFDISLVWSNAIFTLQGTRSRQDEGGNITRSKLKMFKVSKIWAETLLATLRKTTIPLHPEDVLGCDGTFYSLELGNSYGGATYRWWSNPPKGWDVLPEVAHEIIHKFSGKMGKG